MQEMQETQVQSLGQEDPLEKGVITHSNCLAWKIPWTELGFKSTATTREEQPLASYIQVCSLELHTLAVAVVSRQVISDSSQPHGLQHARPPCPSLSPGVCPSSSPLKR